MQVDQQAQPLAHGFPGAPVGGLFPLGNCQGCGRGVFQQVPRTPPPRRVRSLRCAPIQLGPQGRPSLSTVCRETIRNENTWWDFLDGVLRGNTITLKTHTPQIWGVEIHPPNLGGESSNNTCFTVFSDEHSLNLGGEIFTPQIWGVWVVRVGATRPATLRGKWHSERVSERAFEKPLKTSENL